MSTASTAPKKLSAIEIIEGEIKNFITQREQAVSNLHAIEGAIQAGNHLLAKLKAAEAEAVKLAKEAVASVEGEASKVIDFVKAEVEKI